MHKHNGCDHNLKYCAVCNVVYCAKCKQEWGGHNHWYPMWNGGYIYTTATTAYTTSVNPAIFTNEQTEIAHLHS